MTTSTPEELEAAALHWERLADENIAAQQWEVDHGIARSVNPAPATTYPLS